jgi:hypothetical protein
VSDESQFQITKRPGSSLAALSSRSSLIARGRTDAARLARCNKCFEVKELVFGGCVCADCSEALDRQWGGSTATEWVLITTTNELMRQLGLDERVGQPRRYLYEGARYPRMKRCWSTCEPSFRNLMGPANTEEVAKMTVVQATRYALYSTGHSGRA